MPMMIQGLHSVQYLWIMYMNNSILDTCKDTGIKVQRGNKN